MFDDDEASHWAALTVKDLKAELLQRGLPLAGNKAALVARLDADDETAQAAAQPLAQPVVQPVAQPAVLPAAAVQGPDWSSMSVKQLKAELSNRGLTVSGNKTTLINRLNDGLDVPANASAPAPKPKRARGIGKAAVKDESEDEEPAPAYSDPAAETGERRLRAFVEAPDAEYKKKLKKVKTERLFMLDRQKGADMYGHPTETFDIAGSTGNVYQTTISRSPNCECMDAVSRISTVHDCSKLTFPSVFEVRNASTSNTPSSLSSKLPLISAIKTPSSLPNSNPSSPTHPSHVFPKSNTSTKKTRACIPESASPSTGNVPSASSTWNRRRNSSGAKLLADKISTSNVSSNGSAARMAVVSLVFIAVLSGRRTYPVRRHHLVLWHI